MAAEARSARAQISIHAVTWSAARPNRRSLAASLCPKELIVNLFGADQILQLLEARERAELERFRGHVNLLEQIVELLGAAPRVPRAFEAGQMLANLIKRNAVAPIVRTLLAEGQFAAGENFRHDLCDFFHAIIVPGVADVENLVVHGVTRSRQHFGNGLADVEPVNQRTPRRAIRSEERRVGKE